MCFVFTINVIVRIKLTDTFLLIHCRPLFTPIQSLTLNKRFRQCFPGRRVYIVCNEKAFHFVKRSFRVSHSTPHSHHASHILCDFRCFSVHYHYDFRVLASVTQHNFNFRFINHRALFQSRNSHHSLQHVLKVLLTSNHHRNVIGKSESCIFSSCIFIRISASSVTLCSTPCKLLPCCTPFILTDHSNSSPF